MLPKLGKALGVGSGTGHAARAAATANLPLSIIGSDVKIVGNIVSTGEMQIDGQVEGDISCRRLLIGESGRITGELNAEAVQIHGELIGKVTATEVLITRSGRVTGDVIQDTLEIEAGATIEGRLIRRTAAAPPATTAEAEPAPATTAKPKANGASDHGHVPQQTPDLTLPAAGTA